MQKIPVTRGFDKTKVIGYLALEDGIEISANWEFTIAYTIISGPVDNPSKIRLQELVLVPKQINQTF